MSALTVEPVASRADLREFIGLPFRLHDRAESWVPPLIIERRQHLDRRRNPFFQHADAEYFLARRGDRIVGRITAHVDSRWDEYQGGNDGMFGFFEAEEDPEIARALLDTAAGWVRERGRERMLGPMDFSTNDECGLLIEGFDEPSLILEPWHPPYYRELLEGVGLGKTIDLLMWELRLGELKQGDMFAPLIHKAAAHSREKGVVVRNVRRRDLAEEVDRFMQIYNVAWGKNWGFVPITAEEVRHQAKQLRPVLAEEWMMAAEVNGKTVGCALSLPDINQALTRMGGRLLPLGWWHYLRRRRYIDRVRVFALGVLPEYQHYGVAAALYERHLENARRPNAPITWGHMGWILETNKSMNRAMEGMGGRIVKRYRIFETAL